MAGERAEQRGQEVFACAGGASEATPTSATAPNAACLTERLIMLSPSRPQYSADVTSGRGEEAGA